MSIKVSENGTASPLRVGRRRDDLCADLGKQGNKFVHGINAEANSGACGWLGFLSEWVDLKHHAGNFGGEMLRARAVGVAVKGQTQRMVKLHSSINVW